MALDAQALVRLRERLAAVPRGDREQWFAAYLDGAGAGVERRAILRAHLGDLLDAPTAPLRIVAAVRNERTRQ